MGHVRSKIRSLDQILEKPCVQSRGQIFSPIIIKLGENINFVLMKPHTNLKWVMSDQRLGQVIEKACVCCRGHIFSPIIMKLGENVCLDETSDELENGSCRAKI